MDSIIFLLTRKNHTNGERIGFENGELADTIPRTSYVFNSNELDMSLIVDHVIEFGGKKIALASIEYIHVCGHTINVKCTIDSQAESNDVLKGWNLLKAKINLDRLSELCLILEINDLNKFYDDIKTNKVTVKGAEPRIILLARLAYWYFICSNIPKFEKKIKDVHDKLRLSNVVIEDAKKIGIDSNNVKEFIRQLNTTISELIIIAKIYRYDQSIISFEKNHEFLLGKKIAEVKTITPEIENTGLVKITDFKNLNQLKKTLLKYLKRPNIKINHLHKALEKQNADIIFLNITFAYEHNIIKYLAKLEEAGEDFSVKELLEKIKNIKSQKIVPLVFMFTAMGFEYTLFMLFFRLRIKKVHGIKKLNI